MVFKFHGGKYSENLPKKVPCDTIMGEVWEILLSGVKSRDRPTLRKHGSPVDMNMGPNVGDLSHSDLSPVCGKTHRATLFPDYLRVGLTLTTCNKDLFQAFIRRVKNAFKGKIKLLFDKLANSHLDMRI